MINHIPPIGSKRVMVYMAEQDMKPIDKSQTLLDSTMRAKEIRSIKAHAERSNRNDMHVHQVSRELPIRKVEIHNWVLNFSA